MRATAIVAAILVVAAAVAWACDPPGGGINISPDGAAISGTSAVDLTANSETEAKGVDVCLDGNLLESLSTAPYSFS